MGGRAEQQQLRRPGPERRAHHGRRFAPQEGFQHGIEAAGAAQDGGGEAMRRRTVARRQRAWQRIQRFFQRPSPLHHGREKRERRLARGHAGRAGGAGGGSGRWAGIGHRGRFMAPAPVPC